MKIHPEGWYHKKGNHPFGDYVSVHFFINYVDVMRSRCGQRVKNDKDMMEYVLISSPDEWERVFCGNCERLIVHDQSKKNQGMSNESS